MRSRLRRHDEPLLFKYSSAETAVRILATRSLRWSSPVLFNDPFDVRRDFELPFTHAEFISAMIDRVMEYVSGVAEPKTPTYQLLTLALRSAIARGTPEAVIREDLRSTSAMTLIADTVTREEFRRIWAARVPGMRILCLSTDPEAPPMWAHYASDLSGVVLGFETSDERDSAWLLAQPVIYQERPPSLPSADVWVRAMMGEEEIVWERFLAEYYLAKSLDWSYEREYRVPADRKPSEDGLFSDWTFAAEDLREIRLGPRTDAYLASSIRQIAARLYPDARVMNAVLDSTRRRIVVE